MRVYNAFNPGKKGVEHTHQFICMFVNVFTTHKQGRPEQHVSETMRQN